MADDDSWHVGSFDALVQLEEQLDSFDEAAITKAEFMIILVLQNPSSRKYKVRLSEFTSGIASQCRKDWALVLNKDLVVVVKAALTGSTTAEAVPCN